MPAIDQPEQTRAFVIHAAAHSAKCHPWRDPSKRPATDYSIVNVEDSIKAVALCAAKVLRIIRIHLCSINRVERATLISGHAVQIDTLSGKGVPINSAGDWEIWAPLNEKSNRLGEEITEQDLR